jgi:uncharacterized surface protein with fasciclin (FAS1) repeats
MNSSWTHYANPPKECVNSLGKVFVHNDHNVLVKVLSYHVTVGHITCTEKEGGDLPTFAVPTLLFEICTGNFKGQKLAMDLGSFFGFFTEVGESVL